MSARPRVLSGMQPTGELHLGNYLGALRQWARLSADESHETLFCVVDAHAITVDYDPKELPRRVLDAVTTYIAGGIDPSRSTLFVQSDVPAHMELAWYLTCLTPMGDLHRMTQFKDKSAQHKQNVNAGLFTYPVLMAADILVYRASVVPVGDDQVQHLELAREICRRFNARFGEVLVEPMPRLSPTPRILGVDGKAKMSKSLGNTLGLLEPPEVLEKKLRGAFTDPAKLRKGDPGHPEICNVFTMQRALAPEAEVAEIERTCRDGSLGCGDCKKSLAGRLLGELAPIRERAAELQREPRRVLEVLHEGGARARSLASETMRDVRRAMGLGTEPR
ncbi:MAG: tryptophan--tRNA ligase [Deltaproteobacteria bacterium]|nr:tryptophan--tRNA ligase [Deltaproteobacteria bacterium]